MFLVCSMFRHPPPTHRQAVLGDAVRDSLLLWISCAECGRRVRLAPAALAKRLGYDFTLGNLRHRMRCSRCGARDVEVRLEQPIEGPVARHD